MSNEENQLTSAAQAAQAAQAASEAARVIALAASEAARVVATSATEALKASNIQRAEDHDLLIKLETKVDILISSVNKLMERDDDYVLKEDFNFWRNILVSSIVATIFVSIVLKFIGK